MKDRIRIRPFRADDKERVEAFFARMKGESAYFFNRLDVNAKRARTFFDGTAQNIAFFLAEDAGDMVGYIFLRDTHRAVAWLGIAVDDAYAGQGLGTALMTHVHDYAQELGLGGILLTTHCANIHAQMLYTKMGYERIGTHTSGEFLYIRRFDK